MTELEQMSFAISKFTVHLWNLKLRYPVPDTQLRAEGFPPSQSPWSPSSTPFPTVPCKQQATVFRPQSAALPFQAFAFSVPCA